MNNEYVLITGASGVLGGAFAREIGKLGYNMILTGRTPLKLDKIVAECRSSFKGSVYGCVADFSKTQGASEIERFVLSRGFKIKMLVNVAGADIQKPFEEYTSEKILFQCRTNFESAVRLTRFALANGTQDLQILNVSSVSGIYPMPYYALYSATKGALTSFSVALREEVKKKGVHVTAVLPGAIPTRPDVKAQIQKQGLWGKLAQKPPEFVVKKSLKALKKNKAKLIPGFWNKFMNATTKFLPLRWKLKYIAKRWKNLQKDAF